MTLSNSARQTKRYLITSQDPQRLAEAIRIVKADPTMELLDEIGPANQPHTLVVGMGDEQAAALKQRFAGQQMVGQLEVLAHNLLIWARRWLVSCSANSATNRLPRQQGGDRVWRPPVLEQSRARSQTRSPQTKAEGCH